MKSIPIIRRKRLRIGIVIEEEIGLVERYPYINIREKEKYHWIFPYWAYSTEF